MQKKSGKNVLLSNVFEQEAASINDFNELLGIDATLTSPYTKPWVEMQASMGAPWVGVMGAPTAFLAGREICEKGTHQARLTRRFLRLRRSE